MFITERQDNEPLAPEWGIFWLCILIFLPDDDPLCGSGHWILSFLRTMETPINCIWNIWKSVANLRTKFVIRVIVVRTWQRGQLAARRPLTVHQTLAASSGWVSLAQKVALLPARTCTDAGVFVKPHAPATASSATPQAQRRQAGEQSVALYAYTHKKRLPRDYSSTR